MGRFRFLAVAGAESADGPVSPVDWQREIQEAGLLTIAKILVVLALLLVMMAVKTLLARKRAARQKARTPVKGRRGRV